MGAGARRPGVGRTGASGRAVPGMMLHQDGSSHEWVPGRWWDLVDDATSDIYSAFFVAEEGLSFDGLAATPQSSAWREGALGARPRRSASFTSS